MVAIITTKFKNMKKEKQVEGQEMEEMKSRVQNSAVCPVLFTLLFEGMASIVNRRSLTPLSNDTIEFGDEPTREPFH